MNSGGELSPPVANSGGGPAVALYSGCVSGKDEEDEEDDVGDGEYGDGGSDDGSEARLTSAGVTQSAARDKRAHNESGDGEHRQTLYRQLKRGRRSRRQTRLEIH